MSRLLALLLLADVVVGPRCFNSYKPRPYDRRPAWLEQKDGPFRSMRGGRVFSAVGMGVAGDSREAVQNARAWARERAYGQLERWVARTAKEAGVALPPATDDALLAAVRASEPRGSYVGRDGVTYLLLEVDLLDALEKVPLPKPVVEKAFDAVAARAAF